MTGQCPGPARRRAFTSGRLDRGPDPTQRFASPGGVRDGLRRTHALSIPLVCASALAASFRSPMRASSVSRLLSPKLAPGKLGILRFHPSAICPFGTPQFPGQGLVNLDISHPARNSDRPERRYLVGFAAFVDPHACHLQRSESPTVKYAGWHGDIPRLQSEVGPVRFPPCPTRLPPCGRS